MTDNRIDREFLGRGIAFPLQMDPRGGLALATGPHDIEQAIKIVLGTVPGERVMRPEFGCRAYDLVFDPRDAATESLLIDYVREALGRWEPRIEVRDVIIQPDPDHGSGLFAEIVYEIKATHDQRSIVYPFFLEEEA